MLKIMSSFTPSPASHALSTPSMTAFFCASDNAARGSTLPDASFGAAVLSIVATHSSPIPEYAVRIAGAPEMMPSKKVG